MATNPTLLTMPIAENGQKNTIPATQAAAGDGLLSQSTGFPPETALPLGAGGKAPTREDFNGAFNLLSDIAFYAQKGWTFQYDATQDYFKGCLVIDPSDGLRYECINDMVAGTVSPHEDTDNDYWKVFSTGGGVPVGFIMPYAGTGLQEGWLDCDGSAVSRTMYPALFAAIGTTFGPGDGSTTFNLPDEQYAKAWVGSYASGSTAPVIYGNSYQYSNGAYSDVRYSGKHAVMAKSSGGDLGAYSDIVGFDQKTALTNYSNVPANSAMPMFADLSSASAATITPQYSPHIRYMIKAFDGQTPDSALIDITQYAADLANKADRSLSNLTQTGEDHFLEQDFTIIYPNGGTAENPSNVSANSRYVETNPFPGYIVNCVAEVLVSNQWGETGWFSYGASPNYNTYGTNASQLDNDDIVIQTGNQAVLERSALSGSPFGNTSGAISAPCRVKVWKIGKVASA